MKILLALAMAFGLLAEQQIFNHRLVRSIMWIILVIIIIIWIVTDGL